MGLCSCRKAVLRTEVGMLEVFCCENGIHSLLISTNLPDRDKKSHELMVFDCRNERNSLYSVMTWLIYYFKSSLDEIKEPPPVCSSVFVDKGEFTVKVWKTLMTQVAFGQTVTYGQLAALAGNPSASRAVGSAMKNNCIPLIIPCHRVIKSDGKIGDFASGKNVKEWLLNHEKASFKV